MSYVVSRGRMFFEEDPLSFEENLCAKAKEPEVAPKARRPFSSYAMIINGGRIDLDAYESHISLHPYLSRCRAG